MLEKLTKGQKTAIPQTRDKWIDKLFCGGGIDRVKATTQIEWLYSFAKLGKPTIIFLDSPLGAQIGGNLLKDVWGPQVGAQVGNQVGDQVWDQVWDQVRSQVRAQVWDQVWDRVGAQVRSQVRTQVGDQVRTQVGNQVWDQVRSQVGDQVWDQVGNQVRNQVWENKMEYFDWSNYGNVWDYGWCAFYDYFRQIGINFKDKDFNQFTALLDSGIYDMIQFDGLCIVCAKPEFISRDEQNRLHCENGETIRWADGFKLWFWHGVPIPGELIIYPNKITKKDIIKENNAEVRRCYQEILGSERFAEVLGVKEIDSDIDLQGNKMSLVVTEKDELANDIIKFANVVCPSTGRKYFLCVPPNINNVWEAVAWTFGKKKEEYSPVMET